MKKLLSTVCVLLVSSIVSFLIAHEGGHYQKSDVFDTWTLKNGKAIRGNFCLSRDGLLVLEQTGGKLVSVPINNLISSDHRLAETKISHLKKINNGPEVSVVMSPISIAKNAFLPYLFIASLSLILACVLMMLFTWPVLSGKFSYSMLLIFSGLTSLFYAFKFEETVPQKSDPLQLNEVFSPYKAYVKTTWDEQNFYISSTGIPEHNMMIGIKSWQQQVPVPQAYTGKNSWEFPLQPQFAKEPLSTKSNFMRGAVAIAVNGIPIFNALNNRGEDAFVIGELDNWGGHCGKADDYHYHTAPLSLQEKSGLKPIAFALDGFAVYGSQEPDGTAMKALDNCHGHLYTAGNYHYHGTKTYPYVIGAMRGIVKMDDPALAPENQIVPQVFTSPLRPPEKPLRGAVITAFTKLSDHSYLLSYQLNGKPATLNYTWDENNRYTFKHIDVDGRESTNTYERRLKIQRK
ncbi:MAG: YHYH protein [Pyrinomonadaceae bacterium]|nr:YHYH protein [Sphingobacteriaceae bacterium]